MLYEKVVRQIRTIPYDYLLDVENYIQFVMYKDAHTSVRQNDLSKFYGSIKLGNDGLSLQKEIRNEWN